MALGIAAAVAACLFWGLTFVAPLPLTGFAPAEIAAGRFLAYGLFSAALMLPGGEAGNARSRSVSLAEPVTFLGKPLRRLIGAPYAKLQFSPGEFRLVLAIMTRPKIDIQDTAFVQ